MISSNEYTIPHEAHHLRDMQVMGLAFCYSGFVQIVT